MHPDLVPIVRELEETTSHFQELGSRIPEAQWNARPTPGRWSVAENVAHLNLTTAAYLPLLDAMLEDARRTGGDAPRRFRKDLVGWLLWRMLAPGSGGRQKTAAQFIPQAVRPKDELLGDFARLNRELMDRIGLAAALPVQRVKVASPFSTRVKYNGYACFAILSQHERRHLHQARAAWTELSEGAARAAQAAS